MQKLLSYFSFQGRANRQRYWLTALALLGIVIVVGLLGGALTTAAPLLGIVAIPLVVAYFWVLSANAARRLHDRNKSAWWLLLLQVVPFILYILRVLATAGSNGAADAPLAGLLALLNLPIIIWAFVELGCLRGTVGPNRFGDDPLQPAAEVFA